MNAPATGSSARHLLLILAFVGFISLGLPDAVIGVAWPSVRQTFDLHQSGLGLVLIGSGCGYFLSSFFSGRLIQTLGVGLLLAISSVMVAASGFGYALAPAWPAFVVCSLLHGMGSGAIDAGLNNFGAAHFTARHMNWLHACYCLGAMLGPLLMTSILAGGRDWRIGYATLGTAMLTLSVLFGLTQRRWGTAPERRTDVNTEDVGIAATLRHPGVWLQIAVFFVYTGLEVTVGQWSYTLLTEARGIEPSRAGLWVSLYWGSIGIGRVLLGFLVERIGIDRLLRLSTLTTVLGSLLFALGTSGPVTLIGLLLIGLSLAPIFPGLMSRTPQRLGAAYAVHAIGFQVSAAMAGAALLPSLVGLVLQEFGLGTIASSVLVLACFLIVLHESLVWRSDRRPG